MTEQHFRIKYRSWIVLLTILIPILITLPAYLLRTESGIKKANGFSLFSFSFILFLSIAVILYFLIEKIKPAFQWTVLLLASYIFYAATGIIMLLPIIITTVMTWIEGLILDNTIEYYKVLQQNADAAEKKKNKDDGCPYEKKHLNTGNYPESRNFNSI